MRLIVLATFVAMAVGQFNMPTMPNFMNNWNPYAFGANVAGKKTSIFS